MITIGIDIGGTSIKCGFVDKNGLIIKRFSLKIDYSNSQEDIINTLGALINKEIVDSRFPLDQIKGLGIGCPGSINSITGYCDYSNNLNWHKLPVVDLLKKKTGLNGRITNDANAAALGEAKFGEGKEHQNLVLLTLGTGVGGGLFLNGKLYEGNEGKGAELGHSLLVMDGRQCTCGRKGCLEAYASVTALIKDTKIAMNKHPESLMWNYAKAHNNQINGFTAFESMKLGDLVAKEVVTQYIHFLSEGILNLINIFRPDIVVLGGGLSNQRTTLTDPINHYLEEKNYGFGGIYAPKVKVVVSSLGNDAGIIGAAALMNEQDLA